jgi:putative ABC transport system permease protein
VSFLKLALARLRGLFVGSQADDDLRAELEAHLEMETDENIRRGMSPEEARRQARIASGGMTQAAEAVRDQRGIPLIEGLAQDFRYAFRALKHSPAFTIVVVLTLALGIGANTAIFTVVRGVLLKPLPHREGERLVFVRHSMDGPGGASINFSVPEVRDFRAGAPSLGGIAEFSSWNVRLMDEAGAENIDVGLVTGNYFEVMGLSAVLGRVTRPADDGPGVPIVAVLTHESWQQRFGGDTSIVGRQLRVDGKLATVIGVLQPAPFYPEPVAALFNMVLSDHHLSSFMNEGRTHRMTEMVARLAPGATIDQARAESEAVLARVSAQYTDSYIPGDNHRVAILPFKEAFGERARLTLWLLMAAAMFVLVISAANVTNLTLMRGVRREHELVVRAALGAGAGRLRRLLMVENLLLTFAGAALGTGLAVGGVRLLTAFAARYSPRADEIALDGSVLAFTVALAASLAMLLSFAPFLPREGTLASVISAGLRRIGGGLRKQRLQRTLVVAQVAASVVLLAGAGLLTRTMLRLADVKTGLRTEEVLTMSVSLLTPSELLRDPINADAGAKKRYAQMLDEIRALPGVVQAAIGSPGPLRSSSVRFEMKAEGRVLEVGQAIPRPELRTADPEFFDAAGIPLLAGRPFAITDERSSAKVVILNQTAALWLFAGADPIGKRVAWTGDIIRFTPFSTEWRTVVGVVANTQDGGLDATSKPAVYLPFAQELAIAGGFVIRADTNVASLVPAATRIVRRLAPSTPIANVMTIAQIRDQSVSPRRLNAALLSSFSLLAVLIAAVGITGVLAFSVGARTTEIGIRMSLGASAWDVERMILSEGGKLLAMGLVLGIALTFLATQFIEGLLFGVAPRDPVTLVAVAAMMGAIGLLACWIPARRAARIDPAITLRS